MDESATLVEGFLGLDEIGSASPCEMSLQVSTEIGPVAVSIGFATLHSHRTRTRTSHHSHGQSSLPSDHGKWLRVP